VNKAAFGKMKPARIGMFKGPALAVFSDMKYWMIVYRLIIKGASVKEYVTLRRHA